MNRYLSLALLFLAAPACPAAESTNAPAATPEAVAWDTGTVARIDGQPVPFSWFVHELRSSYVDDQPGQDPREKAFSDFMERLTLYQIACRSGVTNDAAFQARSREHLAAFRSYLDYQMHRAEMSEVVQAFISQQKLGQDQFPVTDEEMEALFTNEVADQEGAPATLADVPVDVRVQMREHLQRLKQDEALKALLERERTNITVEVNTNLIKTAPYPQMNAEESAVPDEPLPELESEPSEP